MQDAVRKLTAKEISYEDFLVLERAYIKHAIENPNPDVAKTKEEIFTLAKEREGIWNQDIINKDEYKRFSEINERIKELEGAIKELRKIQILEGYPPTEDMIDALRTNTPDMDSDQLCTFAYELRMHADGKDVRWRLAWSSYLAVIAELTERISAKRQRIIDQRETVLTKTTMSFDLTFDMA